MKTANDLVIYEVVIKQNLRAFLDISERRGGVQTHFPKQRLVIEPTCTNLQNETKRNHFAPQLALIARRLPW